jgi:hypothetical protein
MTDTQIFQLLGMVFFATGVGMLVNPKFIENILQELEHSSCNMFYGGLFSLVTGYLLVSFHNVWKLNASLMITIMGWMALIKGLALIMFPASAMRLYKNIDIYNSYISYCIIAFGTVLLYLGYFA